MRFFLLLGLLFILSACGVENYEDEMAITGWSKIVTLTSYDPNTRASLQADFTQIDGANTFTISFEVFDDTVSDPVNDPFICPMALLTWSVEGNSVSRLISVRSGTSISGVGEHVVVSLWDDARPGVIGAGIPPTGLQNYRVAVNIAPGVRGPASTGPIIVPYMYYNDGAVPPVSFFQSFGVASLSPGGAHNVRIDVKREYPLADSLYFLVSSSFITLADTDVTMAAWRSGGTSLMMMGTVKNQGLWIPLQPNVDTIVFYLNPALVGGTYTITAMLGVDG